MKSSRILVLTELAAAAVSCNLVSGGSARLSMTIDGLAQGDTVVVSGLNANAPAAADTFVLGADGGFRCRLKAAKGDPEFYYVSHHGRNLASVLASGGESIRIHADTTGIRTVSGSSLSQDLAGVERDYAAFLSAMDTASDIASLNRVYLDYYHSRLRYILHNPTSLTVVPVLFQKFGDGLQVFSHPTDALYFRKVCDTLKTVYPDSRYVRALETETRRRENLLRMENVLSEAKEIGFPDLTLPDTNGKKTSLSEVDAKAVLVHFWTCEDAAQTLLNEDSLKPVYEQFHKSGLEIYSVCVTVDKARWATVVRNQNLPWINVCDGLGADSPALRAFNVSSLPTSVLIADGQVASARISGEKELKKNLSKLL